MKLNKTHAGQTLRMYCFLFACAFFLSIGTYQVHAQQVVTGKVVDTKGMPIPLVNVLVKGTTIGILTDNDGLYTINAPASATLLFSSIGFVDKEELVGTRSSINPTLESSISKLDEVVVVGYGSQKKVNLTGSVSSVKMDDLTESRPITNLSTGLAGLAAGVQINSSSPRPGNDNSTIRVRGQGTLNDASPLVIIDGVEGNIGSLNPQDVETMSVLKDAASASIYGSRAANGVILITTKKGKEGKMKMEYNGYLSIESVGKTMKSVSNYADYMELMNEGFNNSSPGINPMFSKEKIDLWRANENGNQLLYPNTDWVNEVFNTSTAQNHVLSLSGASKTIRYYTSFGFLNNPGVMDNSGNKRYSLRSNIESKVNNWLIIGTNLSGSHSNIEIGSDRITSTFSHAAASSPGMVLRHPDGRYGAVNNNEDDPQANNPLFQLNSITGGITERDLRARLFATITPFKGLSITGSYTYEFLDKEKVEKPLFIDRWNFLTETVVVPGADRSSILNYNQKTTRQFMDVFGQYNKTFLSDKLNFTAMAGASQEQRQRYFFDAKKQDLLDPELNLISGAIGEATANGYRDIDWAMRSFFGRINIGWDNKYLLELNLRSDGSSRFKADNRWGYFPSASAAWRIDQESFFKDLLSSVSALKLRASYGSLGNSNLGLYDRSKNILGDYSAVSVYSSTNYILNNVLQPGIAQTFISNAKLSWETTYVTNLGMDVGLLNNRLSLTADYFNKKSVDILINLPAPGVHGASSIPRQNSAEVVNKGFELSLGWQDRIGSFQYYIQTNFTWIANKVTKFKGDAYDLDGTKMIKEGLPINIQYVRKVDRLVQNQADLDVVEAMLAANSKAFASGKKPELGDLLYKDLNGDGLINDEGDRTTVGNGPNPKFYFGTTVGASWKGIDFSILIQGQTGIQEVWLDNYFVPTVRKGNLINQKIADGRWVPGRTDAKYPRLLQTGDSRNRIPSDWWIQNKSYVKIRNIQLGYTLPKLLVDKLQIERIRLYGSMENFFTFTSYDGLDPEVSGVNYPTMKQLVFGINVTF